MITLYRTDSSDPGFQLLVRELDQDLAIRNGEANAFFAQYNKSHMIHHVVLAYHFDQAVACGAMKEYSSDSMEIKRMYALPAMRRKGMAAAVLQELEKWAHELGYQKCVLETGDKMPEAIGLYKKSGYRVIPNYGPYENVSSSICFEKHLN